MDWNIFFGAVGAFAGLIAVIIVISNPQPGDHSFIRVILGAFVGLFFGMTIGSLWVGAEIIFLALTVERGQANPIIYNSDIAITYTISTTVSGVIGGTTGASIGIAQNISNRAAIWGAIIGAVVGVVFVRVALLI